MPYYGPLNNFDVRSIRLIVAWSYEKDERTSWTDRYMKPMPLFWQDLSTWWWHDYSTREITCHVEDVQSSGSCIVPIKVEVGISVLISSHVLLGHSGNGSVPEECFQFTGSDLVASMLEHKSIALRIHFRSCLLAVHVVWTFSWNRLRNNH